MYEVSVCVNGKESAGKVKATVSVVFDEQIKVTGIRVMEKTGGGLYVAMPAYPTNKTDEKGKTVYASVCQPRTPEFAAKLKNSVLAAYEMAKENPGKTVTMKDDEGRPHTMTAVVTPFTKENSNLQGIGTLFLGEDFRINNLTVSKGQKFDYVDMPSYKTSHKDAKDNPIYQDYCYPITAVARKEMIDTVLNAYQTSMERNRPTGR